MRDFGNEDGFTLTELMTVVIILAVLVAIAVPIYVNVQEKAAEKACQANQRIIEDTINMWIEADQSHKIEDVTMADLKPFWVNDPKPFCPLGNDPYTFDGDGHVICPNRHDHY